MQREECSQVISLNLHNGVGLKNVFEKHFVGSTSEVIVKKKSNKHLRNTFKSFYQSVIHNKHFE